MATKKKRKRKFKGLKRPEVVRFHVTEQERDRIYSAAENHAMTVSQFLRALTEKYLSE